MFIKKIKELITKNKKDKYILVKQFKMREMEEMSKCKK